ncbi:hypothetical protein C8F04DRAFT_1252626 [Mycena alexandri]|uniref:CxC2-like cysteine cluster KDZ transposase-associated domain-containing protein n=1 Tax=Mycena alexandri TaxID=1745969 RepID=A0AAD6TD04_9AGAR|nr:hypothetical protein C8F04DRAFT_1252626 [Mycena alexandri]
MPISATDETTASLGSPFPADVELKPWSPTRADRQNAALSLLCLAHDWAASDLPSSSEMSPSEHSDEEAGKVDTAKSREEDAQATASPMSLSQIQADNSDEDDAQADAAESGDDVQADAAESEDDVQADTAQFGHCDFCSVAVGPTAAIPCRIFRCDDCGADKLCESCCYDFHVCHPEHVMDEYLPETDAWVVRTLGRTLLHNKFPMNCGTCGKIVTPVGRREPAVGTLVCNQCQDGMHCPTCILEDHAATPLHKVLRFNGRYWDNFTLAEVGFIYDMGHEGRPCEFPEKEVSSLVVIEMTGCNKIAVRYCNCGKFSRGQPGRWEQIRYTGWYASLLDTPGMCSTFEVRDEHGRLGGF